ncbi:hypothetical protein OPV22_005612 [Ensete ventricosum]|uniref:Uncharacterized protein n=1 Tax=Ensete ventricosum TaxID=4639 RepID=A0AAV8RIX1_ENSVE|nr:hypothetical protein OPV22_005612 [Ensete ventricosum]
MLMRLVTGNDALRHNSGTHNPKAPPSASCCSEFLCFEIGSRRAAGEEEAPALGISYLWEQWMIARVTRYVIVLPQKPLQVYVWWSSSHRDPPHHLRPGFAVEYCFKLSPLQLPLVISPFAGTYA